MCSFTVAHTNITQPSPCRWGKVHTARVRARTYKSVYPPRRTAQDALSRITPKQTRPAPVYERKRVSRYSQTLTLHLKSAQKKHANNLSLFPPPPPQPPPLLHIRSVPVSTFFRRPPWRRLRGFSTRTKRNRWRSETLPATSYATWWRNG